MENNSLFQGQPPQSPSEHANDTHHSICPICAKPIGMDRISCNKCHTTFHLECTKAANVHQSFTCTKCSRTIHLTDPPRSDRSHSSSVSNASRSSIVRKRDLDLRRLEEERQLAIERDREFLTRKYQLLEQVEVELNDTNSTISNSVQEWLDKQPKPTDAAPIVIPPQVSASNYFENRPQINDRTQSAATARPDHTTTENSNQNNNHSETIYNAAPTDSISNRFQTFAPHSSLNSMFHNNQTNFIATTSDAIRNCQINSQHFPLNSTFHNNKTTYIETASTAPAMTATPAMYFIPHSTNSFIPSFSSAVPSSSLSTNLTYQQINARQTVPKDLPIFSGKPEEWPLFSSTYNWSTSVCGLTDAENLIRLQKSLCGDALRSVQHILIHPSCVPTAISTLQLLYGQPEKIVHSLKLKIRSLPTINPNRLETITSFAVQVKGLQSTIEACGLSDELNNSSLLQELVSKLPSYFQINWGTFKMNMIRQNKRCNLLDFSDWIFDIGLSASSVHIDNSIPSAAEPLSRSKQRNAYVHTHTDQTAKRCLLCQSDCDGIDNCQQFIAADRTERWNIVREHRLCRQCLRKHFGICNNNKVCGIDNCQFKHHPLLHKQQVNVNRGEMVNVVETSNNSSESNLPQSCNTHSFLACDNLFKIIPVTVYRNKDNFLNTYAFIDEGSSTSLIDEKLINELNLTGTSEPLCLKWTGDVEHNEEGSLRLSVPISGTNKKRFSVDVHTVKNLSLPQQSIDIGKLVQQFSHLQSLPIQGYMDAKPRLLIGLNNSMLCVPGQIKEGRINEPIAVSTRLGWLIYGSMKRPSTTKVQHIHVCECSGYNDDVLHDLVKKFYSLETSGISNTATIIGKEEEKALSILEKCTIQRSDKHYETSLLWRSEEVYLPNSLEMAKKRFVCLERRLKHDENLRTILQKTILEYKAKGYITKIGNIKCVSNEGQKIWYLPIFPVCNQNKPGKVRIVWDAAAKVNGISLNTMLLKGPDLLTSLPSVLYRFRQKSVAICGDIAQMFHQIFVRKEDRDVQRFLWRTDDSDNEADVYVMNVMTFGASCAPCTSQYIKNMNASKFEEQYPVAAAAIKQNHYVDDFLDSVNTTEDAINLATDVKFIHSQAGFHIRNWLCNDNKVLKALHESEINKSKNLTLGELYTDKVLGIFWSPMQDLICFKISSRILESDFFLNKKIPTKRGLLRILMTVYDPLGLIGHFLMYLKIVLQDVWRSGTGWDKEIDERQMVRWIKWLSHLTEIQNIKIPRCYLQNFKNYDNLDVQLHTFADASENGYAAVGYFRISNGTDVVVSLIGSKTRVAPIRISSIPRLELMAATMASRFANNVCQSHSIKINRKVFWTDSKTVISWLRSDHKRYHQFVAFRVNEILESTELNEWRWIPGRFNVADEATKWCKAGPNLNNDSRWLNGPDFLRHPERMWPLEIDVDSNVDCEVRQHLHLTMKENSLIDVYRFSQWRRLLRSVAYVACFIRKVRMNKLTRSQDGACLDQNDLKMAETIIIKQAQSDTYLEEIAELTQDGNVNRHSSIYKLTPYVDNEGVLRIDSRIGNANISQEFKYPAIMPKNSRITELLIMHYHSQYHHGNHETAINEIRQKYYVPRLRTCYKKIIHKCQMCKVRKTLPTHPQMAKLPRARLSAFTSPFTFTGLDFFGPIFVTVGRHKEKRYGALFTCLTIRAVHVEVVHSLTTSSCILAIRNFTARRGTPREYFSDNGTNFVGAERELREAVKDIDRNEFIREFTSATTKWNFNPPASPHMGGAWERMVRSIKTVLYKIMPTRLPNDEILRAMMAEVENIINSRPLTYVPIDDESKEALTPNHFLLGCSNGMKPLASYDDSTAVLRNSWLSSQEYAGRFWKRWIAEYLPSLTCRTKWFEKSKPLTVGDLVVVVDPSNPRNVWPRGRIVETKTAADGQVRSARVMTSCGILERPVAKLAVLDVAHEKE